MNPVEKDRDKKHQCPVEYVNVSFFSHEFTVFAHYILNDSEDRSNHNEATGDVKDYKELLPWCLGFEARDSRLVMNPAMKHDRNNDKHAEEDELDKEADYDDELTSITSRLAISSCKHAAA